MTTKEEDLNGYLPNYTSFNDRCIRKRYELLEKYFVGTTCLELGPANGEGTTYLLDHFSKVVAVDGSQQAIDDLKERFPTDDKLETVCSYFEELELDEKFDTIVLAHVLEHVDNPNEILVVAKKFLKPEGVLIVDVPNALSLHRQIGVEMGLLKEVTELNEGDLSIGHKRVYTPEVFKKEVEAAGLKIARYGGVYIKILSNAQSETVLNDEQLDALHVVGERYPEIAAEQYVVAQLA
jgi:2-polyprenyl-3-methyl-5-hydroxy-6-metoxy-1,4-benzoquinol methylase